MEWTSTPPGHEDPWILKVVDEALDLEEPPTDRKRITLISKALSDAAESYQDEKCLAVQAQILDRSIEWMLDSDRGEANQGVKGLGEMLILKSIDLPGTLLAHTADMIIHRIRQNAPIPFNQKIIFDILGKYLQRLPQHALLPAAIAGTQGDVDIQARSGLDVLNDRIIALSECPWSPSWVIALLEMIRDLSLLPSQISLFITKGIRSLSLIDLEKAPMLIYQLLLLSRKTDQINVLSATLTFLAKINSKDTSDSPIDQVIQVENSIFLYVGYAMRLDQKLGGTFLKWIKSTRTSQLSPHSLAILLMISEVVRYQDAALDLIRSHLILAIKDTRRIQNMDWMKAYPILHPPDPYHILLFSIGRVHRGWEQLAPPLLRLLLLLMDSPLKPRFVFPSTSSSSSHTSTTATTSAPTSSTFTSTTSATGTHGSLAAWTVGPHPELPPFPLQLRLQAIQGLVLLFKENVHMRADILRQCSGYLSTPTLVSLGILEALETLSVIDPDTLFHHSSMLYCLMDVLPFQSLNSGKILVRILCRLAIQDLSFRGSLFIALQKGLLSREESFRQISTHGLLFLVGSSSSSGIDHSTCIELLRKVGSAMQQDDQVCDASLIDLSSGPCQAYPEEVLRILLGLLSPILEPVDEGSCLRLRVDEITGATSEDQKAFGVEVGPIRLDQRVSRAWSSLPLSLSLIITCLSLTSDMKGKKSSKKGLISRSPAPSWKMPLTIQSIRSLITQINRTDMSDWQLRHVLGAPPRSNIHPGYLHRASILLDVYTILMDGCLMIHSLDPSAEKEDAELLRDLLERHGIIQGLLRDRGDKFVHYHGARGSIGLERIHSWFVSMAQGNEPFLNLDLPRQIAIGKILLSSLLFRLHNHPNLHEEIPWGREKVYEITRSLLQLLSDPQGVFYQVGATTGQRQRKSGPTIVSLAVQVISSVSWDMMMCKMRGKPIAHLVRLLLPQSSMSLLHDLGANEEREDEGEGEACFRRLLDVMCKVTLACANEYVRLFKEAHRLLLHTQFMTYTFGVPLRKGFYQDLLGKEPFGDVTYGKRLLSRFLLDQWSHDVLGKGEEVALSLVQNLQSTLGLIEGNEETEESLVRDGIRVNQTMGGPGTPFPFIPIHNAESVVQSLLDALIEVHESINWSWFMIYQEYRKAIGDGNEESAHVEELEPYFLTQIHYLIRLVIELEKASLPIPSCTLLLGLIQSLYETLAAVTKMKIKHPSPITMEFRNVVTLACDPLSRHLYSFLPYVQHADVEATGSRDSRRGDVTKKRRVSKAGKSTMSTSKEIRIIPKLIYCLEQFEQNLILLSKKSKVDLTRHLRRSTARDFRIQLEHVVDLDDEGQEEEEEEEEEE